MLTQEQLSHFRSLLQDQRRELTEMLDYNDRFGTQHSSVHESLSELSSYDNHPADYGTETFERGKDIALNEHTEEEIRDITRALEAMDKGTYGKCEVCGENIPVERLEAIPSTVRCVKHAADQYVSQRRPVEEDVLRPEFGQFEYDERDATLYDAEDSWQEVERYGTSETPSDFYDTAKFTYNEMFVESDENVGYVEDLEGFLITDMYGNSLDVNTDAPLHEEYEKRVDRSAEEDD
nr:TraR/DksA C4-type zinc finger protein [Aneurinibacillus terranovensis]